MFDKLSRGISVANIVLWFLVFLAYALTDRNPGKGLYLIAILMVIVTSLRLISVEKELEKERVKVEKS